ncbi:MAG: endonuclease/exonuclease/phosphatase family protein [Polyangiaceae bacterium]
MALLALVTFPRPAAAQDPPQEREPTTLEVLSYNVWGVPWVAPEVEPRLEEIARQIADRKPDVVALQELWLPEHAELVTARLEAAGYPYHHFFGPGSAPDDEKGSGLYVASRLPITDVGFEAFTVGRTPHIPWHVDWMAHKGVGTVKVDTPAGPVVVADTHLHATYLTGNYDFVQLSQALQLARRLVDADDAPLILVGDLNAPPDSLPVRALSLSAGLEPASETFDIDQILARPGSNLRLEPAGVDVLFDPEQPIHYASAAGPEDGPLSDHPCIVARYRLVPCETCAASTTLATTTPTLDGEIAAQLDAERRAIDRIALVSRAATFSLPFAALWLFLRRRDPLSTTTGRPRLRRALDLVAASLLLLVAVYSGYLGFHFAPKRLAEVDHEAATFSDHPAQLHAAITP